MKTTSKRWGRAVSGTGGDAMGQWYDVNSRKSVSGGFENTEYSIKRENSAEYSFGSYGGDSGTSQPRNTNAERMYQRRASNYNTARRNYLSRSKVLCLLLACLFVGGCGGVATFLALARYTVDTASSSGDETVLTSQPINTNSSALESNSQGASTASSSDSSTSELTGQEIYALGSKQTVGVTTEVTGTNVFGQTTSSTLTGTGIIISSDGYILTNYHVVETAVNGGYEIDIVLNDGTTYDAKFVGKESDSSDVAILKIDATELDAASLGDSGNMQVGQTVYTIGNPLGELTYTFTSGIVSALDREISFSSDDGTAETVNMFQIDAAVNSGNSGGPVYNTQGEVIGIVTAKYNSSSVEGIGFAIPVNDVLDAINDLMNYGYVSGKASMGVETKTISSTAAAYYQLMQGAYVTYVYSDSCAETSGIKKGDVIVEVGEHTVTSTAELSSALKSYLPGDETQVIVYRDGEYLNMKVTFDEDDGSGDQVMTTSSGWYSNKGRNG